MFRVIRVLLVLGVLASTFLLFDKKLVRNEKKIYKGRFPNSKDTQPIDFRIPPTVNQRGE